MMLCLPTDISENANSNTTRLVRIMKILCGFQVVVGIFLIFVDLFSGIFMLINALLYALVIWTKNWCMCLMFIIICLFDMMSSIMLVGNYFSENDPTDDDSGILIMLYMIKFPVYMLVIYYTFLGYRELKGLFIETVEIGGFGGYGAMEDWYDRRRRPPTPPPQPAHPQPFTGTGYRID